jgi:hypothetical protein
MTPTGTSQSPSPLGVQYPHTAGLEYLQNLPAYNCNQGVDSLLDLLREIQESGNYYYQGLVFPDVIATNPTVPGGGTINGVAVISPGTYITGISGIMYNSNNTLGNAGFNLKIYDKATKSSIFYGDYAQHLTVSGHFTQTQDDPSGPALLQAPFILTGPGVIGWEIVNRSASECMIQVLVDCAVPITNRSVLNTVVGKG